MTARTTGTRDGGQVYPLMLLFMTAIIGAAAAVIDVGSWYRAHRSLQGTADAAALAAAQGLPDTNHARSLAVEYAGKNGGGVTNADVTFTSHTTANDTVTINAERPAAGVFTRLFGIDSVSVSAHASARAIEPVVTRIVTPLAVNSTHSMLNCSGGPCYGVATELSYHHPGSAKKDPLAFGYVDLLNRANGAATEAELARWITDGFTGTATTGIYVAVGDPTYISPEVRAALESHFGDTIIVPVFKSINKNTYDIVTWASFKITGLGRLSEHHWRIYGSFERTEDSTSGSRDIALVE
jgi:hypothetical protein